MRLTHRHRSRTTAQTRHSSNERGKTLLWSTTLCLPLALCVPLACGGSDEEGGDDRGGAGEGGSDPSTGGTDGSAGEPTGTGGSSGTQGGTGGDPGSAGMGGVEDGGSAGEAGGGNGAVAGNGGIAGGAGIGGNAGVGGAAGGAGSGGSAGGGAGGGSNADLSCLGANLPTVAVDPLDIAGTTNGIQTMILSGVSVQVFARSGGAALDSDTSAGDGSFSLSVATGGSPLPVYFLTRIASHWDTYTFPAQPLYADVPAVVLRNLSSSEINVSATVSGGAQMVGNGVILLTVRDCRQTTVTGATASTMPSLTPRYLVAGVPSATAMATSADGTAAFFNAAPGNYVVDAGINGQSLREQTVTVYANALTVAVVMP